MYGSSIVAQAQHERLFVWRWCFFLFFLFTPKVFLFCHNMWPPVTVILICIDCHYGRCPHSYIIYPFPILDFPFAFIHLELPINDCKNTHATCTKIACKYSTNCGYVPHEVFEKKIALFDRDNQLVYYYSGHERKRRRKKRTYLSK